MSAPASTLIAFVTAADRADVTATVTFQAPADVTNIIQYTLYAKAGDEVLSAALESGLPAAGDSASIALSGLTNVTSYALTVVPGNASGDGAAQPVPFAMKPYAAPSHAPVLVSAARGDQTLVVTFSAPSVNNSWAISGYRVYVKLADGTAVSQNDMTLGEYPASGNATLSFGDLNNTDAYVITATTLNAAGESVASAPLAAAALVAAAAPANVLARRESGGKVTLAFSAYTTNNSLPVTGYNVFAYTNGSDDTITISNATFSISPADDNGDQWVYIYIDTISLDDAIRYSFKVVALCASGNSAESDAALIAPTIAPQFVRVLRSPNGAYATIHIPDLSSNLGGAIDAYQISARQSLSGPTEGDRVQAFESSASDADVTFKLTGLDDAKQYHFKVYTKNAAGPSTIGVMNRIVFAAGDEAPAPPSILSVERDGSGNGIVRVTPNEDGLASGYIVTASARGTNIVITGVGEQVAEVQGMPAQRNPSGQIITPATATVPAHLKFVVPGLHAAGRYTFSVMASNKKGYSAAVSALEASAALHSPVQVNFEVEITGDSNINVFGEDFKAPVNVVVAEYNLPVDALYDASGKKGLIELWEPLANPNNINVCLAKTDSSDLPEGENLHGAWEATVPKLARGLERVLCENLDCSGATPFNAAQYKDPRYTKQTDFGHLALSAFAHYMFGHVNATAAITNDKAFLKGMLSLSGNGADAAAVSEQAEGGALRYATYTHEAAAAAFDAEDWAAGDAADANLARRLVAAILAKGLDSEGEIIISDIDAAEKDKTLLSNIVRQVIGQDETRLMNEDNSQRTVGVHRLLRFYAGDVIYMNIKLLTPTVTVGSGQTGNVTATALQNSYVQQSYTLKITLGA